MDCLFCRVVSGEIPSRRVHADDHALAFLDIEPFQPGHTLVIPRRHVSDLTADPDVLAEIAPAISAVSRLLLDRLDAQGINMLSNAGKVAGQEVFHLHVHLVPRYEGHPGLRSLFDHKHKADDAELAAIEARLAVGR